MTKAGGDAAVLSAPSRSGAPRPSDDTLDTTEDEQDEALVLPELEDDGSIAGEEAGGAFDDDLADDLEADGDPLDDAVVGEAALGLVAPDYDIPDVACEDGDAPLAVTSSDDGADLDDYSERALFGPDAGATGFDDDDDELGIDEGVATPDDGGAEGLDDLGNDRLDAGKLPPLDGDDEDADLEEIDVGVRVDEQLSERRIDDAPRVGRG